MAPAARATGRAKGPLLLGIRLVIAESFERIHRSNLVGMGVLPLQYNPGDSTQTLGLDGSEVFSTLNLDDDLKPGQTITVQAEHADGHKSTFETMLPHRYAGQVDYYRNGASLHTVLRNSWRINLCTVTYLNSLRGRAIALGPHVIILAVLFLPACRQRQQDDRKHILGPPCTAPAHSVPASG